MSDERPAVDAQRGDLCRRVLAADGALRLRVEGGSMAPTVMAGDVLVVEPVGAARPAPGTVVLMHPGAGPVVVHRVVASRRRADGWVCITAGDASGHLDQVAAHTDVLGQATALERDGAQRTLEAVRPPLLPRLRAGWRLTLHGRAGPNHPLRALTRWGMGIARALRRCVTRRP